MTHLSTVAPRRLGIEPRAPWSHGAPIRLRGYSKGFSARGGELGREISVYIQGGGLH